MTFVAVHESRIAQVFGRRDDETDHALKRPATKKAPRHEVAGSWAVAGSKRYWDRMSALPSMLGAAAAPDDGHLGGHAARINGRSVD